VVGCYANKIITGKPPYRVGLLGSYQRGDQVHEIVASECWTTRIVGVTHEVLQPIAWSFSIGGNDLHVHHNKIIAISNNEVGSLPIPAY